MRASFPRLFHKAAGERLYDEERQVLKRMKTYALLA